MYIHIYIHIHTYIHTYRCLYTYTYRLFDLPIGIYEYLCHSPHKMRHRKLYCAISNQVTSGGSGSSSESTGTDFMPSAMTSNSTSGMTCVSSSGNGKGTASFSSPAEPLLPHENQEHESKLNPKKIILEPMHGSQQAVPELSCPKVLLKMSSARLASFACLASFLPQQHRKSDS